MGRWPEELFPKEQGRRRSDSWWSRHLEMSYTSPGGEVLATQDYRGHPKECMLTQEEH